MEKMKLESVDITVENIEKIKKCFLIVSQK